MPNGRCELRSYRDEVSHRDKLRRFLRPWSTTRFPSEAAMSHRSRAEHSADQNVRSL